MCRAFRWVITVAFLRGFVKASWFLVIRTPVPRFPHKNNVSRAANDKEGRRLHCATHKGLRSDVDSPNRWLGQPVCSIAVSTRRGFYDIGEIHICNES
ncbi:hypothetical protein C8R48DRAFT_700539, partial [Suillus tomentosus]